MVQSQGDTEITMPTPDTLERFIARVESNLHAEAVEGFYTTDASIQENQSVPRIGRTPQAARERVMLARATSVTSQCVRPVFVSGDKVVIRWIFRFVWPDETVTHMEELAYQRWEGDRIAEETFFYDPAQTVPKQAHRYWPRARMGIRARTVYHGACERPSAAQAG